MNGYSRAKLCLLLTVIATAWISPAAAQSGSRLCGLTADIPVNAVIKGEKYPFGGKIGLLYECKDEDKSYREQCDRVIAEFKRTAGDAELRVLTWREVKRDTCESVGHGFVSTASPSTDMCAMMDAKIPYTVTKHYDAANGSARETRYVKM